MARFPWLLLLRIRDLLRYVKLREILYHRPIVGKTFRRHVFPLSTGLDAVLPKTRRGQPQTVRTFVVRTAPQRTSGSVASELLSADTIAIDTCRLEHAMQAFDHARRPGDVVDRRRSILQMLVEHSLIDNAPFPLPGKL